ncbi:MAG: hypothetical protein ACYC7D_06915 [Nitrososphaerales archaeon]
MMSTDYTQALRSIKQAEETSNREISERKKALEENLRMAEEEASRSIAAAKQEAESMVAVEVERTKLGAQAGAETLLSSTTMEASGVAAKKLSASELRKIIEETLLSEFKGA